MGPMIQNIERNMPTCTNQKRNKGRRDRRHQSQLRARSNRPQQNPQKEPGHIAAGAGRAAAPPAADAHETGPASPSAAPAKCHEVLAPGGGGREPQRAQETESGAWAHKAVCADFKSRVPTKDPGSSPQVHGIAVALTWCLIGVVVAS